MPSACTLAPFFIGGWAGAEAGTKGFAALPFVSRGSVPFGTHAASTWPSRPGMPGPLIVFMKDSAVRRSLNVTWVMLGVISTLLSCSPRTYVRRISNLSVDHKHK